VSPTRRAPRRGRIGIGKHHRWASRTAVLACLLTAVTGCKSNAFTRMGMPVPITREGHTVLSLWQGSWIAGWAVGAVVWGLIVWSVIFYRKRSDDLPAQVRYNLPIEMLYTIVPFVVIAVFFYFTARDENYVDKLSANPDVVVNVVGFQWSWQFNYPQYNVTMNGLPYPGPLPVLEIPTGETVRFNLTSADVIHSFWVPQFLFKRDVVPGHPNHFEITPTVTGTYLGHCTELCGVYHSKMLFTLKVVTPQQFQQFIAAQQAAQKKSSGSAQ
jgi:cytochrome c oxidase subunit 2